MAHNRAMIRVNAVSKKYGLFQALEPTDLVVPAGSFTTILGPSGSGKTTLLRLLAGLEEADSGSVYVQEQCFFDSSTGCFCPPEQRQLAMVFQDFALWPHLTVFENVAFSLRARRQQNGLGEAVAAAIDRVNLNGKERRYPHELSGGEQQRVSFARAIVAKPMLILLDEPLSALDAMLREQMRLELKALIHELKLTAIYVTHDQVEGLSLADQLVVMSQGRIQQVGSPETVYRQPSSCFVADFLGQANWSPERNWLVRPEVIQLTALNEPGHCLRGQVKELAFHGDRYEILVDIPITTFTDQVFLLGDQGTIQQGGAVDGKAGSDALSPTMQWIFYHHQPLTRGALLDLYFPASAVIRPGSFC